MKEAAAANSPFLLFARRDGGFQDARSVPAGYSRYGLLLESEGRPVGAILTIYASVPADGAFAIRCNVSS